MGGRCGQRIVTGQAQHDDVTRLFGHIRWNTGPGKCQLRSQCPRHRCYRRWVARTEQSCMHPEQAEQSGEACWALLCSQYQASARSCWPRTARLMLRPRSPGAMASASASGGCDHAIDRGGHSSNGIERRSTALYGRVLNMTMMGWAPWAGVDWHGSSVPMVEGAISTGQLTQTLEHHTTTRSAKQTLAPEWRRRVELAHWPPQASLALRRTLFLIYFPSWRIARFDFPPPSPFASVSRPGREARVRWGIDLYSRGGA
jgi:hypothetical protein